MSSVILIGGTLSYVIPIGRFLLGICLASWQVEEWVSQLVPPVARDGNIIQISRPALARAEYIIMPQSFIRYLGQCALAIT